MINLKRDRYYVFEDVKLPSSDPLASAISTNEWLESLERAKAIANEQAANNAYSGDDSFNISNSALSSSANTMDQASDVSPSSITHVRATLQKQHSANDGESLKAVGRKRFSKRQSKSGLAAVF
jgi:3-phosphoinositide dependent protein kinase-1